MNGRDGRYDSDDMNDADWLLSQLGSGRRPDLEGRNAPEPPVAQPPRQQPGDAVPPPPGERPRRRSEESLDWFSLAESDAATRELPVVGEPVQRGDGSAQPPVPPWAPQAPAWEPQAPAWNQPPAWDDRRPPMPPRHPESQDRLTSVEPPVGAPVPPAFGGPPAPPAPNWPPPGPVTPPANFALTWGEQAAPQPLDTEEDLRAAFRQLSEPEGPAPVADEPVAAAPDEPDEPESPFAGFTPPPVARQSFTPVTPAAGIQAFPPARTDFDDELWSALNEEPQPPAAAPGGWAPYDDGRGYSDEQAYADASGQDEDYGDRDDDRDLGGQGYDQHGFGGQAPDDRGYDRVGYEQQGYDGQGYDRQGYEQQGSHDGGYDRRGYDQQGYDEQGYDQQGYDEQGYDRAGYDERGFDERGFDARGYDRQGYDEHGDPGARDAGRDDRDDVRWYADRGYPDDGRGRSDERDPSDAETDSGGGMGDGSPMARELAQTGYFWNLTPDPSAPDPLAASDEHEQPGPRRRGSTEPAQGDARGGYDRDAADDTTAAGRHDDGAAPRDDAFAVDGDPYDRFDERTDGGGDGARYDRDDRDDDRYHPRDDWRDEWSDRRGDERTRGYDDRRDEPPADTDGLASLFGGAGFGATAPTPLIGGTPAARSRDDDPFDRMGADPYDRYDRRDDAYGRDRDDRDRYDRAERAAAAPAPRPAGDDRGGRSPVKVLAWIAGGLAAVLLVVAGVAFGAQLLGGGEDQAADEGAGVAEPTGPQPPGTYAWDELYGGECLEPFDGPWSEEFTVIDCDTPHAAQLVLTGEVSTDEAAPFPGEAELATQVAALCGAENVIDPDMAALAGDLQVEGTYPVTEEQWNAGERTFHCFVTRRGGSPITADVQGTAGQQG